ncbi:MAG TPA: SurA N-terminal domain-containing protein [Roseiarcus sp.]|nr:SurA N-terminal domain-containing protein [Roseiarcus sp.]
MLDGMRKATQGLIGRFVMTVVLGLIIVSFVVWGIGDMFRASVSDKVAEVGGAVITVQQFQSALQNLMYQYQTRSKTGLTNAQAHALGLDSEVLQRLVAEAALDQRAASLGLAISDDAIAAAVRADPNLQDASGQFSRARFDAALRDSGLSERGFFASQSRAYLRQQIELALVDGLSAPKSLVDALARVDAQTRAIDYLVLPPGAAGDVPAPATDALKGYFEDRKANYRAPEYRGFAILPVSSADLAKPAEVSDEDAKALYDKVRDARFIVPEKRKLQQIVFANEAEAAEAEAKIKGGAAFDDIVKARDLKPSDIDLGETTKAGMFDPAIAEAAFVLPEGGVSDVVKGRFGPVIVRVVAIAPANAQSFAEVEDALKKEIAANRAAGDVQTLHDKIEDARVAGKSLTEAAKSVGLETRVIAAVDAQGLDPTGAAVDLPEKALLLRSAFASDVGVDDAPLQTKDRGYLWFEVAKVEPARERAFEEVKDAVEKQWRADEVARLLGAKALDMVKQLDAGASVASLAQSAGLESKSAADIRRRGGGGLAESVVSAVFGTPPNGAGSAATPDGRVVFKIAADATPPTDPNDPAIKQAAARLADALESSLVTQYVTALERELGVTIHDNVLQAAEGG